MKDNINKEQINETENFLVKVNAISDHLRK